MADRITVVTVGVGDAGALRKAAEIIADRARLLASAWSRRIPPSIRVSGSDTDAAITAGGPAAPMAYTFEAPYGPSVWHPVYGHGPRSEWGWAAQVPRPFMRPAVDQSLDEAANVWSDTIIDAHLSKF